MFTNTITLSAGAGDFDLQGTWDTTFGQLFNQPVGNAIKWVLAGVGLVVALLMGYAFIWKNMGREPNQFAGAFVSSGKTIFWSIIGIIGLTGPLFTIPLILKLVSLLLKGFATVLSNVVGMF